MKAVTLRQLRYFEALARLGRFGRAAEACAISQPALSMQIRELEQSLGTPLFERGGRQARLTGFGEEVALRARDILRSVDELGELARAARDRMSGPLRIGVIPTAGPYLLPRMIGDLARAHPGLDLRVRETVTPRLMEELAEGRLDTAIVALPAEAPGYEEAPVCTEEFVLVRPAAEAGRPVPAPELLREMRLLLLEEGHCLRDQALAWCQAGAAPPREIVNGSSLSTLVQMVAAGIGVTLAPEMAAPVEARSADVSIARFAAPRPTRTLGLIWRARSPLAPQLREVADVVRGAADALRREREAGGAAEAPLPLPDGALPAPVPPPREG